MFRGLTNLAQMLGNARQLQERMEQMQEQLAELRVEGVAGGGMVTAITNGKLELVSINIEDQVLAMGDRELLEGLVLSAVSTALAKAREAAAVEMSQMAGGMSIPGLSEALERMGPGGG